MAQRRRRSSRRRGRASRSCARSSCTCWGRRSWTGAAPHLAGQVHAAVHALCHCAARPRIGVCLGASDTRKAAEMDGPPGRRQPCCLQGAAPAVGRGAAGKGGPGACAAGGAPHPVAGAPQRLRQAQRAQRLRAGAGTRVRLLPASPAWQAAEAGRARRPWPAPADQTERRALTPVQEQLALGPAWGSGGLVGPKRTQQQLCSLLDSDSAGHTASREPRSVELTVTERPAAPYRASGASGPSAAGTASRWRAGALRTVHSVHGSSARICGSFLTAGRATAGWGLTTAAVQEPEQCLSVCPPYTSSCQAQTRPP